MAQTNQRLNDESSVMIVEVKRFLIGFWQQSVKIELF